MSALLQQLHQWWDRIPEFLGLAMIVRDTSPTWRQFSVQIVAGIVIGLAGGVSGGYIVLKIDQAVQEARIVELERRTTKVDDRLHEHQINGAIHYYGARQ